MHARLKKLESDNNMDLDTQRATLGRAASIGSTQRHQTSVFATQSAPPVDGDHQDLQKAQIQVCLYLGSTRHAERCPVAPILGSRAGHLLRLRTDP